MSDAPWPWPHFMPIELACHKCGIVHGVVHPRVLDLAEAIRAAVGHPLTVNSASRCKEREREIYAAQGSRPPKWSPHLPYICEGYPGGVSFALDLYSPLVSGNAIAAVAERLMPASGIGVKMYGGRFCHVDVAHLSGLPHWRPGRRW